MKTQLFKNLTSVLRKSSSGIIFLFLTALAQQAQAAIYTYDSTAPSQLITHVDTACTSPLSLTFNVTDVFTVGDLDVGLNISTLYRADIDARLISPLGTSIYILQDDGSSYDDWDITLDDASANSNYFIAMNTAAPLYDVSLSPKNPLSAFDGEAANGTWTLELCDDASANDSTFNSARLTFDDTPKLPADLSVTQSFSTVTPNYDDLVTVTVSVTNSSASAAEGVTLLVAQPTTSTYNNYALTSVTAGSYANSNRIWSVGTVAAGQTETLIYTIPAKAGTGSFYAYVNTSANSDPDSTPGNTVISEDDYVIQTVTTSPALGHVPGGGRNICYKDVSELALDGEPNTWDKLANNAYFGAGGSVAPEDLAHTGFWTINTTTLTDFSCDIWLGGGSPDETATETVDIYSWLGSGNRYVIGACDYTHNDICNDVRTNVDIPNGGVTIDSALTYNPLGCGGALTVNTYGGASTYFTPQAGDVVLATHDPGGEPAIISDAINGGTFLLLPDADMLGQSGAGAIGSGATATTDQAKLVLNTFKLALDEIAGRTINSCTTDFNNPPGTISGFVYTDSNGDDAYQSGTETPLQSVTVSIYGDPATPADPSDDILIDSVETDINGAFSFIVSQDNSYRIEVDTADTDLAGLDPGTPNPINSVTVVSGGITPNQNFGFESALPKDYSDAPANGSTSPAGTAGATAYGTATHVATAGIQLGASITTEFSAVENADNASDNGINVPTLTNGETADVIIAANDITVMGTGTLHAWIDFNGNGLFDIAEYASTSVTAGTSGALTFSAYGTTMNAGTTYARFRMTSDALTSADTATAVNNGEVEDYSVTVSGPVAACGTNIVICSHAGSYGDINGSGAADLRAKLSNTTYFGATGSLIPETFSFISLTTIDATQLAANSCQIYFSGYDSTTTIDATEQTALNTWINGGTDRYILGGCDSDGYDGVCDSVGRSVTNYSNIPVNLINAAPQNPLLCSGATTIQTAGGASGYFTNYGSDISLATYNDASAFPEVITDSLTGNGNYLLSGDINMWITPNAGISSGSGISLENDLFIANTFKFAADNVCGRISASGPICPGSVAPADYSDAPASYGSPNHEITAGLHLGSIAPDNESSGQASPDADGDDTNGTDDEDGISGFPALTAGATAYTIPAGNVSGTGVGTLHAWIDFNGDGSFATTEHAQVSFNNGASADLSWTGQSTQNAGTTYARFRLTSDVLTNADAATAASDGEVEDYSIVVETLASLDYGDAPSDLSAVDADLNPAYPTLIADGAASHTIGGATFLGASVDAETDGQPNTAASGDSDDGVQFPTLGTSDVLMLGQSNTITVTASTPGFLNAWMDINQDGDWNDAGEQLFSNQALIAGNNALVISTATTQPTGDTYLRFRFTSTAVTTPLPTGALPDGEVEDYRVAIVLPEAGVCSSGLINGGFESPASGFGQYNEDAVPGWATIANDPNATSIEESNGFLARNRIEIWNNGFNGVPSYEGNQFAEINAHVAGALYQDLETTPGTLISYQFAHRGRSGDDTVDVFIGAPGATSSQTGGVGYTTGNTAWQVYTGSYTVPVGQTITRFSFKAISSAGGVTSVGNFVDAIQFGFLCNDDYSDAPADGNTAPNGTGTTAYGEAVHRVDNSIRLGSNIDADTTSITSLDASGDGTDDDGLITLPTLTEAAAYNLQVSVVGSGRLTGWIDFAGDGTFDSDDTITGNAGIASTGGTIDLPIHIPAGSDGTTFLRLRFASDTSALTASGTATDGEVEDYQITILPKITNPTNPASTPTTTGVCTTYNSTGSDQLITAPIGTQGLTVKMWGAGGGHEVVGSGYSGAGGYSEAEFDTSVITGGDVFSLVVGRGGNTSVRPDEFTPGSVYGFGSVTGHDQGGGLTGLFTGNTAVSETDQARALLIAGGGGGYEHSGDAGTGVNGGNGNSSTSGGQPTMRGSTDMSPSFNGLTSTAHRSGGGGGYYGGGRLPASSTYSNTFGNIQPETAGGAGGAGFVSPLAVAGRLLSTADGSNAPPNTVDADYIAGIGTGSSSTTSTAGGNGLAVLCWHLYDYSDAPASYGDAVHDVSPDLQLGSSIDGDLSSLASSNASADGADDDGIATFPSLTDLDHNYQVTVNTTNTTVNPGRLIAWIDFDLNGTFDADEAAARVIPAGTTAGNFVMAWSNIPPDIQAGTTYIRLRFTTDALNASSSVGGRSDGEVEDYQITIDSAGSSVSGRVYIDANSNATAEGSESGIANTVVVLLDFFDGSCRSVTTTASGEYRFNGVVDGSYEVYQAHGETTPVPQNCGTAFANNPTGYQSTTPDTLIVNVSGADEADHNFGEIAGTNSPTTGNTGMGITFEPDHQSEILPGNTAFYAHVLSTEAAGKVSFTTPAIDFGNIANGWTHSLYVDVNCDGDLNGVEANTIISAADEYDLVADERLCIINKVFAPANVPAQDRYEVKTVATFIYPLVSLSPVELEVTDLTIAAQNAEPATQVTPETGASRLVLTKTIENLTQGAAEVEVLSVAQPGDILKYRVYYENVGTGPITDLVINDTMPVYTGLIADSAQCNAPLPPAGMGCTSTEDFGDLRWDFTGSLVGGAKGEVSFEVMVDR
jgi:uncharacterized repeat protein (TIGR01451 family)